MLVGDHQMAVFRLIVTVRRTSQTRCSQLLRARGGVPDCVGDSSWPRRGLARAWLADFHQPEVRAKAGNADHAEVGRQWRHGWIDLRRTVAVGHGIVLPWQPFVA